MTPQTNNDQPKKSIVQEGRAARLRAARAYADLDQADFAKELGVSVVTIKRMERGQRSISLDDLYALAALCGVPRWFVDTDWQTMDEPSDGMRTLTEAFSLALDERFTALADALLTRDEALSMSRAALERLRSQTER